MIVMAYGSTLARLRTGQRPRNRSPNDQNLVEERRDAVAWLGSEPDRWRVETIAEKWPTKRPIDAVGQNPLDTMAPEAPFIYVDPEESLELAGRLDDWDGGAVRRLVETLDAYPRAE